MSFFKSKIWKWIRNGIIISVSLFVLTICGASAFVYYYEDEITKYALEQLSKDLNTEVTIQAVDLTLIKTFPDVSLIFNDVKAKDATKKYNRGTLLKASKIFLAFDFWDIFYGKYNIRKIRFDNGSINIKIYPDGSNNYQILKPTKDTLPSKINFSLKKVILNEVKISYSDYPSDVKVSSFAHNMIFKGRFTEKQYAMYVDANLDVKEIRVTKNNYFKKEDVDLQFELNVTDNKKFEFQKSEIAFADQIFLVSGHIENEEKDNYVDLNIKGSDLNINKLINQIPDGILEDVKALNGEGEMYFDANIKGHLKNAPKISANFGIRNGSIENSSNNIKLSGVNLQGSFSNGINRNSSTTILDLKQFKATLNYGQISGSLSIQNFLQPKINLKGNADFNLADLHQLIQIDTIESITGKMKLNVNYDGQLASFSSFTKDDFMKSICDGTINIENSAVKIKKNNIPLNNINGKFDFNNNDLAIQNLSFAAGKSDFNMSGNIKNFIPFLLIPDQALQITADVKSNKIDMDELLTAQNASKSSSTYKFAIPHNIDLNLDFATSRFTFENFDANSVSANVVVSAQKCLVKDLSLNAMNGNISLNGTIDATNPNAIVITSDAKFNKVDIKKMFYQFNNFGLTSIQEKNLKGILTADAQFRSVWNQALDPDLDKLQLSCNISIDQGELNNFAPLKGLSKFVKAEELENVKFASLKNTIEIKNRTITIPKMDISSSALNLKMSGTHTFDNKIDYRIELLLSDILWNKMKRAKKENEEFGVIEDDGLGKTKLFMRIYGTVDNPQYSYDRIGVKEKIKEDLKTEKQNLKQILNEEFGWFKKDSTLKKQQNTTSPTNSTNKPNDKKKKDDIEDGFKVEWE